jgi:phytoene synthase
VPETSTFSPAFRLLPRDLRLDIRRLYHALRTLDDLVDDERPEALWRVDAVARWAHGEAIDTAETGVLEELLQRHAISPHALLEFCEGMRRDLAGTVMETEEDLEAYCQLVGGAIGIMLAQVLGTSHPDGEAKMATLGRAVQRTNILRDIDEDLARGRVYIARETIARFGSIAPGHRAHLLRDQIARADGLYVQAAGAPPLLSRGRRGIGACAALYQEILRQVERDGYGARPGRAVVPAWRRRLVVARYCQPGMGLGRIDPIR